MSAEQDLVAIGKIIGVFGIAGEMKIAPLTPSVERFKRGLKVWIGPGNSADRCTSIHEARVRGKHLVVRLEGITTREEAGECKGLYLHVGLAERVPLPPRTWFISDIIGMRVVDEKDTVIGTITDILRLPAQHVYVVRGEAREVLIPAVPSIVRTVDLTERKMVVSLIEGLLDI